MALLHDGSACSASTVARKWGLPGAPSASSCGHLGWGALEGFVSLQGFVSLEGWWRGFCAGVGGSKGGLVATSSFAGIP